MRLTQPGAAGARSGPRNSKEQLARSRRTAGLRAARQEVQGDWEQGGCGVLSAMLVSFFHILSVLFHECRELLEIAALLRASAAILPERWLNACRLAPSVWPPPELLELHEVDIICEVPWVSRQATAARNRC